MGWNAAVLVGAAFVAGLTGLVELTQATFGVGLLCGACLAAIFARIVQADRQHRLMQDALQALNASLARVISPAYTPIAAEPSSDSHPGATRQRRAS